MVTFWLTYQLRDELPTALKNSLPTVKQLKMELEAAARELGDEDKEPL